MSAATALLMPGVDAIAVGAVPTSARVASLGAIAFAIACAMLTEFIWPGLVPGCCPTTPATVPVVEVAAGSPNGPWMPWTEGAPRTPLKPTTLCAGATLVGPGAVGDGGPIAIGEFSGLVGSATAACARAVA